jgi:hypothetical protein
MAPLSCGATPATYLVDIFVSGSAAAVEGRSLTIGRKQLPPFQIVNGVAQSFVELCTSNRQAFLHGPIPITVTDLAGAIKNFSLEPLACAFSKDPGPREMDHIFLEDDGTLLTDLASGDPRVWATCSDLAPGGPCSAGDDF